MDLRPPRLQPSMSHPRRSPRSARLRPFAARRIAGTRPRARAGALVRALGGGGGLEGERVLVPRAREARDALPAGLRARGALVDVIPVYETLREVGDGRALASDILARRIDAITFTSSSTVRHFVDLVGREAATSGRFAAAVIGPVTAATARDLGIAVMIEASESSLPGLLDALTRHFAPPKPPARR